MPQIVLQEVTGYAVVVAAAAAVFATFLYIGLIQRARVNPTEHNYLWVILMMTLILVGLTDMRVLAAVTIGFWLYQNSLNRK